MTNFDWVVPHDHPAFDGHFPGRPILPGVVLLDQLLLHLDAAASGMRVGAAKFSSPALPGDRLHFFVETKNAALRFRIACGEREIASGALIPASGTST